MKIGDILEKLNKLKPTDDVTLVINNGEKEFEILEISPSVNKSILVCKELKKEDKLKLGESNNE